MGQLGISWTTIIRLAGLAVALAGCGSPDQAIAPEVSSDEAADQVLTGVVTNLAVDGRRKNYVVADSAFTYQEAQRLEFIRVRVTFFDAEGQPTAELTARRAGYTIQNQVFDARGDVVVITPRRDTLRSARVAYDNVARQFRSDSAFVFKAKAGLVTGKGFTADPGLRNLVSARKRPEPRLDPQSAR